MANPVHEVSVKGWIKKDNKFLLTRRGEDEEHNPGLWALPGGKVETTVEFLVLQKTLQREITEEVGLEVADDMQLVFNNSFTKPSGSHVISITLLCNWKSGEAQPQEDTAEVRWFSLGELQNFTNPPDYLEKEISALVKYLARLPKNGSRI